MKRIALVCALVGSPALAEITPTDVIENWRVVYAGQGAIVSYDAATTSGKVMQLDNIATVEILTGVTTTSQLGWIRLQQVEDGSVRITMSADGTVVDRRQGDPLSTIAFDFSALTILATGFPGDIRYSYSAPEISFREDGGNGANEPVRTVTINNFTGEATARIEVTESGPRVADFGEYHFDNFEASIAERFADAPSTVMSFKAQDVSLNYRVEAPLTDIPAAPVAHEDFPPQVDMEIEFLSRRATATVEAARLNGPGAVSFIFDDSAMKVSFSRNRFSTDLSSRALVMDVTGGRPDMPEYSVETGAITLNLAMPFRKSDRLTPYSLGFQMRDLAFGETVWAETDPENSLGRPVANLAFSVSGLMSLAAGMFDDISVDMPFIFSDAALNGFSLTVGDAAIEGHGNVQFNNRRTDLRTGLPEAKGALDFSISGALGLLDRIGRLNQVDTMMILGAKGSLGMFASPTDTPDSFTSRVEFLSGGGIVVNGQQLP